MTELPSQIDFLYQMDGFAQEIQHWYDEGILLLGLYNFNLRGKSLSPHALKVTPAFKVLSHHGTLQDNKSLEFLVEEEAMGEDEQLEASTIQNDLQQKRKLKDTDTMILDSFDLEGQTIEKA